MYVDPFILHTKTTLSSLKEIKEKRNRLQEVKGKEEKEIEPGIIQHKQSDFYCTSFTNSHS